MLIGGAFNEPLVFEGIEAVNGGLIGDNLASELNLTDEGRASVFADIVLDKAEHRLLFLCKQIRCQTGLRQQGKVAMKLYETLLYFNN